MHLLKALVRRGCLEGKGAARRQQRKRDEVLFKMGGQSTKTMIIVHEEETEEKRKVKKICLFACAGVWDVGVWIAVCQESNEERKRQK